MKPKKFLVITIVLSLVVASSAIKVDVCHNVDNNPHVINIAIPAAISHLIQHSGDKLGECEEEK